MNDALNPGWYESPEHGRRYWDGNSWLSQSEPIPSNKQAGLWSEKRKPIIASVVVLVLVIAGFSWNSSRVSHNRQVHNQELIAKHQQELRKQNAEQISARNALVTEVEGAIKKMAQKHIQDYTISANQIYYVSCNPVGGSYSVLTQLTNTFQCFAATLHNSDGTDQGYYYNATINWDSGEYTYGLGKP